MQTRNNQAVIRLVKGLLRTTFIAIFLFAFNDHVAAKGPESATISGPGIDEPLELVDGTNRDLVVRLMEQTGLWYATGDLPRPLEAPPRKLGQAYTLTWINGGPPHKSVEERTFRQVIYLDTENGPVIHTPAQKNLEDWGPGVIGWFAAPGGLPDTLIELGVPDSVSSSPGAPAVWGARVSAIPSPGLLAFVLVVGLAGGLGVWRVVHRGRDRRGD